ncbi:MAG: transcriptional regulator NrdR [Patescibacteria group bacterium]|nr:transcriptional regulator NrdR [Patescibacteria group bacterium]
MRCIFCRHQNTDVIETRVQEDGNAIRRRRECPACRKRFTTYERVEDIPILVIKRDGRRERFDMGKLRNGIIKAVGKTTVTAEQVDGIVSDVYSKLLGDAKQEIKSEDIGAMVAQQLKTIDKVAYIRFSSVFRRFVDVEEFEKELKKLL